jgi:hypothetical protein
MSKNLSRTQSASIWTILLFLCSCIEGASTKTVCYPARATKNDSFLNFFGIYLYLALSVHVEVGEGAGAGGDGPGDGAPPVVTEIFYYYIFNTSDNNIKKATDRVEKTGPLWLGETGRFKKKLDRVRPTLG